MSQAPPNWFQEHIEYQSELLEGIDHRLRAVQIAAIVFLMLVSLQCLLVILYVVGVISLGGLLRSGMH